jgi:hypothetical protein
MANEFPNTYLFMLTQCILLYKPIMDLMQPVRTKKWHSMMMMMMMMFCVFVNFRDANKKFRVEFIRNP